MNALLWLARSYVKRVGVFRASRTYIRMDRGVVRYSLGVALREAVR